MTEGCGSCTMCCKLLGVAELGKPRDRWCDHCKVGVGCSIHATKPQSCTAFACQWLTAQTDLIQPPGLDQRPDRTKVVMVQPEDETEPFQVFVDPPTPDRWRQGQTGITLHNMAALGARVAVTIGRRRYLMERPGELREVVIGPEDSRGVAHVAGYRQSEQVERRG